MTHSLRLGSSIGLTLALGALVVGCGTDQKPGSIQVAWRLGFGVSCGDSVADIDTIQVRLLNPQSNKDAYAAQSFQCSAMTATLTAVPAGTYNLALEGFKSTQPTKIVFTGAAGGVVVAAGKPTAVGTVVLEKAPETTDPESLSISWNFGGPLCSGAGVANVRIQVWRELVYKQHDQTYPCDSPTVQLSVDPGKYGIIGEGLDATGKVVRRASESSVQVQAGSPTQVTLVLQQL